MKGFNCKLKRYIGTDYIPIVIGTAPTGAMEAPRVKKQALRRYTTRQKAEHIRANG